ncbi:LLM class flavin-dependent oxidoreductase [Microbacterium rhizomatis]|uniref:LLM class flavin-dependent oxidoreductase n=1 Tax=Microbacterium rhizomatis TaxID=1631477 RepID=A0A5J5IYP4_9MICO|nr:LLM class flavin-dependent oxidoreductase [Microbacterium rhizomatis]KAA9105605.1 LLM class flavin-dependent oxidoreductase [Microbacterium rhizomatis]
MAEQHSAVPRGAVSRGAVSIGIAGSLGPDAGAAVAAAAERAGFRSLWVNDTPGGDSLSVLAAAAAVTERLVLATGVIPVDRRPATEIIDAVDRLALPEDRLILGIGAGGTRIGALALVGDEVRRLKGESGARVLVGALGPKMRALAAEEADGALLSWLTPDRAAEQAEGVRDAAPASTGYVALYARTAVDPRAIGKRDDEARRYASYPAYAANFARLGIDPLATVLPAPGEDLAAGAAAYTRSVDELVLRIITVSDTLDEHLEFIEGARDALAERTSE